MLIELLISAYRDQSALPCPIEGEPPAGTLIREVPEHLRGLVRFWDAENLRARQLLKEKASEDGGQWYRQTLRADAVKQMLDDALRGHYAIIERASIDLFSKYRFVVTLI